MDIRNAALQMRNTCINSFEWCILFYFNFFYHCSITILSFYKYMKTFMKTWAQFVITFSSFFVAVANSLSSLVHSHKYTLLIKLVRTVVHSFLFLFYPHKPSFWLLEPKCFSIFVVVFSLYISVSVYFGVLFNSILSTRIYSHNIWNISSV